MNNWRDLEHQLWKQLNEYELLEKKLLVAFSGGVDSLALLQAVLRVHKGEVVAAYIHHGPGEPGSRQETYRDSAEKFCRTFCEERGIEFVTQKHPGPFLNSEQAFREFRHQALEGLRQQTSSDCVALAHHREDLLETRMLRLLRGTGPQGLGSMQGFKAGRFRPFLKVSKRELQEYLADLGLAACEDPSNQDLEPLRNWLRQEWFPTLERRQKGALQALARSLENLVETLEGERLPEDVFLKAGLSRPHYLSLSKTQQKQALARYLLSLERKDFSQAHLEEIQKRLDNSQKDLTFRVGGTDWVVNAQQIRVPKKD